MKSDKVVSLIPARGGSKGIPLKNLYLLNKKPLLYYSITTSIECSEIDETYVSTDNEMIKTFVTDNFHNVRLIDRPSDISTDTSSIEDVMVHFCSIVDFDIIVMLQPTSPLLTASVLNDAIAKFKEVRGDYDSMFSVVGVESNDILLWRRYRDTIFPINYDKHNRGRRQDRGKNNHFIETGAFYITTMSQFQTTRNRIGNRCYPYETPFWSHFEVDSVEDASNIEKLMS